MVGQKTGFGGRIIPALRYRAEYGRLVAAPEKALP